MVEKPTTLDEVRELLRSLKPPIACRVVELRGGVVARSARVLFDGLEGWFVDDGAELEVRASNGSVLLDSKGELRRIGPGAAHVHSNPWAKTAIEPRRMDLDEMEGRVLRREDRGGRTAILIEAFGLKRGVDLPYLMHVDTETGIVLEMSRADLGVVLRVEELRVGTVEPAPPPSLLG